MSVVDAELESMKDFIVIHYMLSRRQDSEYWRYLTNEMEVIPYKELTDKILRTPRMLQEFMFDVSHSSKYSDLSGTLYIAGGMNYSPISETECKFRAQEKRFIDKQRLDDIAIPIALKSKKRTLKFLKSALSSYEFLRKTIYDT